MERRVSAFQKWEAGRDRCRPRKTGGSGKYAWRRDKSRARRHDTGLLRARNQSRKGKNGTGCRALGSRQPCRNAVKRRVPFAWLVRPDGAAQRGIPGDARAARLPKLLGRPELQSGRSLERHSVLGASAGGASRRVISRAALSSSASISLRHSAFNGGDEALGKAFLSKRVCKRSSTSQPPNSARRSRKASRAIRRTRLRVAARGAYFLPITRPKRASLPVGRPYTTKCAVRRHGRKRKTDENSSVFSSLAALGKAACARNGTEPCCSAPAVPASPRASLPGTNGARNPLACLRWRGACGPSRDVR